MPKPNGQYKDFTSSYTDTNLSAQQAENHVINLLEQITLKDAKGLYKNYIAVATIRADTTIPKGKQVKTDDQGFYSSTLSMYHITGPKMDKLEAVLVEPYKRSVTCV